MQEGSNPILENFFKFDVSGEVISSLIVIAIEIVLFVIIGIMAKCHNPLKKPKGLLAIGEYGVEFFDNMVDQLMGPRFKGFGGFVMAIAVYIFLSFIIGLFGLPSPMTNLAVPFSLGLITFVMIHATSVRYTGIKYFKRYIEPIPIFLPINLISMWAPLLSLTLRLFGNAISGWVIMSLVYSGTQMLSDNIFGVIEAAGATYSIPAFSFLASVLHLYFDLFGGFIQTTVFISLSMIFIGQEAPEELLEETSMKGGN